MRRYALLLIIGLGIVCIASSSQASMGLCYPANVPDKSPPTIPSDGLAERYEWVINRIYAVHGGTWGKDYGLHPERDTTGECGTYRTESTDDSSQSSSKDTSNSQRDKSQATNKDGVHFVNTPSQTENDPGGAVAYKKDGFTQHVWLNESCTGQKDKELAQGCYVGCQMGPYYASRFSVYSKLWKDNEQGGALRYIDQKTIDDFRETYKDEIAKKSEHYSGGKMTDAQVVDEFLLEILLQCYINSGAYKCVWNNTNVPFLPKISERPPVGGNRVGKGQDYMLGDIFIWSGPGRAEKTALNEQPELAKEGSVSANDNDQRTGHWDGVSFKGTQHSGGSGCLGFTGGGPVSRDNLEKPYIILEYVGDPKSPEQAAADRGSKIVPLEDLNIPDKSYFATLDSFADDVENNREVAMNTVKGKQDSKNKSETSK